MDKWVFVAHSHRTNFDKNALLKTCIGTYFSMSVVRLGETEYNTGACGDKCVSEHCNMDFVEKKPKSLTGSDADPVQYL